MELVLAVVAIVLSVISLVWQIAAHHFEGDRVIVTEGSTIPVSGLSRLPDCAPSPPPTGGEHPSP